MLFLARRRTRRPQRVQTCCDVAFLFQRLEKQQWRHPLWQHDRPLPQEKQQQPLRLAHQQHSLARACKGALLRSKKRQVTKNAPNQIFSQALHCPKAFTARYFTKLTSGFVIINQKHQEASPSQSRHCGGPGGSTRFSLRPSLFATFALVTLLVMLQMWTSCAQSV